MKLIEADNQFVTLKMSREDFDLLMQCVVAVEHDFDDLEPVNLLNITKKQISDLWQKTYTLQGEYIEVLKSIGVIKTKADGQ